MDRHRATLLFSVGFGVLALVVAKRLVDRAKEPSAEVLTKDLLQRLNELQRRVDAVRA